MDDLAANKKVIEEFIRTVWGAGDVAALSDFWTDDCVNHAMPGPENRGLDALRAYHEGSFAAFTAFTDVHITIEQQIAEGDRVASSIVTRGTHTGPFFGLSATGKVVTLATMRIDRLEGGKIAEHWSTADVAGLMAQIQG